MSTNKNKRHSGFKVPEGYFSDLAEKLYDQAPQDKHIARSGFKVPKDYFEQNKQELYSLVPETQEARVVKISTWKKFSPAVLSVAAVITVLLAVQFNRETMVDFQQLSSEDLDSFVSLQSESMSPSNFAYTLYKNQDSLLDEVVNLNVTDKELEEFLLNKSDISEIMIE